MIEHRPRGVAMARVALRAAGALPWRLQVWLGAVFGELAYWLAVPARYVAWRNVGLCFPALTPGARRRLLRRHFRVMAQSAFAVSRAWWTDAAHLRALVTIGDRTSLDAARAAGRPVILLAPHFLALDVGGLRLSLEMAVVSMFRPPKTALAAALLDRRTRFGALLLPTDAPLRPLVRALRGGRVFYYLPDLDPGDAESVVAPFFGVPTPTLTALSRLARLTDAVVIPCVTCKRPGLTGFEVRLGPPLQPFPTSDALADATLMNGVIEDAIRRMPAQYLWTYRRFKRCRIAGRSPYE
ncbi:MAG: lysophospholipid acyltransferase family protein [Acidiferrobacter sp.]